MKKILIVPHDLHHLGGGTCVAVWLLEALKAQYEVSVLTWAEVRPEHLEFANRVFGTELRMDELRWRTVPAWVRSLLKPFPFPLSLWRNQLVYRRIRKLLEREDYDVVFGAMNELDAGRRSIQYIHFPTFYWPRPDADLKWYHLAPLLHTYRWIGEALSGYSRDNVSRNLTLVNSDWTGRLFRQWYDGETKTVYPPVPGGFHDVPFDEREDRFVCLGRMSSEKGQDRLLEILARVRERGHDVTFSIIGPVEDVEYTEALRRKAQELGTWVSFHHEIPRDQMLREMARSRYGIHGMAQEHFGIAPAELQRAGCVTFVPDDGGQVEIVGNDDRLIYHSIDDAVEKIVAVLSEPELEASIRRDIDGRKDSFSETRFMQEVRDVVAEFLTEGASDSTSQPERA